jgi:hypothetical protein
MPPKSALRPWDNRHAWEISPDPVKSRTAVLPGWPNLIDLNLHRFGWILSASAAMKLRT